MQYRNFGSTGFRVSALGFGVMRLPVKEDQVDEKEAIKMVRHAVDCGINYLDTAYFYHDGKSETILGQALEKGYGEKVKVATKLPCWKVKSYEQFDLFFNEQLERLKRKKMDFYLLHALDKTSWSKMKELGALDWLDEKIAKGLILHPGFSFHDDYETFVEIVDAYRWAICLIQYNYMNQNYQAGSKGLHYAYKKGLSVAVMEPLLGGNLVDPPTVIQKIWDRWPKKLTPVEWAFRWLWNQPEVAVVLSGMSSFKQLCENIGYAKGAKAGLITKTELELYDEVALQYEKLTAILCTGCNYCLPCPQHVQIPRNFTNYNDGLKYDKYKMALKEYSGWKEAFAKGKAKHDISAASCISCGECEEKCPQNIPISRWMKVIDEVFTKNKPFIKALS